MNNQLNFRKVYPWIFLFGIGLLVFGNCYGLGFTYDSYDYWNAGNNFLSFLNKEMIGDKIIKRPPFFPFLLAIISPMGFWGAWIFMMLIFIASSFIIVKILETHFENELLKIAAFALFIFSIPVHLIHSFLWTEALISILVLGQLSILMRLQAMNFQGFSLVTLLSMIAAMTKNGYMLAVPGIALAILFANRNLKGLRLSVFHAVILFGTHHLVTSVFSGMDTASRALKLRFLDYNYLDVLSGWFFPIMIPFEWRLFGTSIILLGLIFLLIKNQLFKNLKIGIAWSFFLSYFFLRSYYSHLDYHESERYLSVVFPVFIIAVFLVVDKSVITLNLHKFRLFKYGLLFFGASWILYSFIRVVNNEILWFSVRSNL
ncbi:MAG: hypothetical protein JXR07_15240 [Reichenbachiella sp.]